MLTSQIADRLVELCRNGQFEAAWTELYADDAISIEPEGSPSGVAEGLDEIRQKGEEFMASVETLHGIEVSEPLVAGNFFSLSMVLDVSFKDKGRVRMEEICVYEVDDGRIVSEQFFYAD